MMLTLTTGKNFLKNDNEDYVTVFAYYDEDDKLTHESQVAGCGKKNNRVLGQRKFLQSFGWG